MQYPLDVMSNYCYRNIMSADGTDPKGFIERVEQAREKKGLGRYAFSLAIDQADSYWSVWISRHRKSGGFPSGDVMERMTRVLGVSMDYLFGKDRPEQPEDKPPEPLPWDELLRRIGAEPLDEDEDDIPIYEDLVAHAGRGGSFPGDIIDALPTYEERKKGKKLKERFRLRIHGRCMMPEINPGDVLLFDKAIAVQVGKVVVALVNMEETVVRRVAEIDGYRVLVANDKKIKPIPVDFRVQIAAVAYLGQYSLG